MTDLVRRFPGRWRPVLRRAVGPVALAGVLGALGAAAVPAAAVPSGAARAVPGVLLPVPPAAPGEQVSVTAVDVSPGGVVAGVVRVSTTGPDGTPAVSEAPQRWARAPRAQEPRAGRLGAGWLRQRLALPAGATSGTVVGLDDRGAAAGAVTVEGVSRAAAWSRDGRSATLIGEAGSRVSAVGPDGTAGVFTAGSDLISGNAELVTRDGFRTPLRGTPEIEAGHRRTVSSVGGPGTALVWVAAGIGRGTQGRPVLWQNGATVRLPVISSVFLGAACVSRTSPGGDVVASGYTVEAGTVGFVMVRHVGGAPGTEVVLARAAGPGEPVGGIVCGPDQVPDAVAPDGGIAGYLTQAGERRAAYWDGGDVPTVVPPAAGERSAAGVAVAGGARMVIQAEGEDGGTRLSLWHGGVRTPLAAPDGWSVTSVVELTEAGLLVANVRDAAGTVRPAAWQLG